MISSNVSVLSPAHASATLRHPQTRFPSFATWPESGPFLPTYAGSPQGAAWYPIHTW